MFGSDRSRPLDYERAVAVDVGEKAKETKEENSFRQKQRSVCKKNLTGPTLLEMSGYPTIRELTVLQSAALFVQTTT